MTQDEILAEFRAAGALLDGHFILSSGLHSPSYLQCARVLMDPARASRPFDTAAGDGPDTLRREVEETCGDPFCTPEEMTPADVFGRVRGSHSTTASNVAKYDGFHGLVVFDDRPGGPA